MQFRRIRNMLIASTVVLVALATPVLSQTAADNSSKDSSKRDDVSLLRQQVAEQQKQIEQLRAVVDQMKQKLDQSPNPAQTGAAPAPNLNNQVASTSPMVPKDVGKSSTASESNLVASTAIPSAAVHAAMSAAAPKEGEQASPLQFHIGSATLMPVGFMDFTSVFRTKTAGGNIGTSFGSIPYATVTGGTTPYNTNLTEFRLSMQNSRIGFRADADVKGAHVIGYMEADFLGTPASLNIAVSTNSNLLRSRLYWLDVRRGSWEILGGQTWSLLTPGRSGISPLPADIFYSQVIDVNYMAGLFWGRIPELRIVFHPSKQVAFAVALDSPDQYGGGSSGGGSVVLPALLNTSSTYLPQLDFAASSGGIATPNVAPDIIAKLAVDPNKKVHFEIGGVERNFKVYDPGTAAVAGPPAFPAVAPGTHSIEGGGGFVNLHVEPLKGFRLLTNNFWGAGVGRYIFGQAPDVIAHANGSLSPIHSGSTVSGFEFTKKNTLIYGYYGGIYIMRNTAIDAGKTTPTLGYGYSGSSNGQNRSIQEIAFGFNQTIWKDAKWGAVNFMGEYQYLVRNPWYVNFATNQPANANNNMVFFNLRYTLPGSAPTLGR